MSRRPAAGDTPRPESAGVFDAGVLVWSRRLPTGRQRLIHHDMAGSSEVNPQDIPDETGLFIYSHDGRNARWLAARQAWKTRNPRVVRLESEPNPRHRSDPDGIAN